jgi:hypothetical protein
MKNQLFSLRDTALQLRSQRPLQVQGDTGHPANKVVDPKRIIGKNGGQGGGEAQGVADPPPKKKKNKNKNSCFILKPDKIHGEFQPRICIEIAENSFCRFFR